MEVPSATAQRTTNHFIMEIVQQILMNGLKSNLIFSPLSLQAMLGLITSSATGLTLNQMLSFLGIQNFADLCNLSSRIVSVASSTEDFGGIEGSRLLSFVNSAWIDSRFSIKPSFREIAEGIFNAEVKSADFKTQAEKATAEINSWAEEATKGLIKRLISPGAIDDQTLVVLVNALYFKATWKEFDARKTQEDQFYLLDGEVLPGVPFMSGMRNAEHFYGSSAAEGFKILKIPYQQEYSDSRQFTMYFFLPDKVDGLFELLHQISSKPEFLTQEFDLQKVKLHPLRIPKFKISYGFEASETLEQLGLTLPFSDSAELTEMIEESKHGREVQVKVSKLIHKAFVEVNEEGTEAAAATAAVATFGCARPPPRPRFVADHPFLFMVREDTTRTVFFIGALINPLSLFLD